MLFRSLVSEASDDWWAGAKQSFTEITIQGGLRDLASSTQICRGLQWQTDDIVPMAPLAYAAGAPPSQRAFNSTAFLKWNHQDEIPAQAPAAALDDGHWSEFRVSVAPAIVPSPQWDDQVLDWTIDEQYWDQPRWPTTITVLPTTFVDTEFAPVQEVTWLSDDDQPTMPSPAAVASILGPLWDDQALSWSIDEQYEWRPWRAYQGPSWPVQAADDDFAPLTAQGIDESYWLAPLATIPAPSLRVWQEDDIRVDVAAFVPSDEDSSAAYVPPVVSANVTL